MAMATTATVSVATTCGMIIYAACRMVLHMPYRMVYLAVLRVHRMIFYHIVALLAAIPYEWLVMVPLVHDIFIMIHLISQPWITIIDHHFVAVIEIIPCKGRW